MHNTFLLNPNCSELVTFLGITEIDEIRSVLRDIKDKYGYETKIITLDQGFQLTKHQIIADLSKLDVDKQIRAFTYNGCILADFDNLLLEDAREMKRVSQDYVLQHSRDSQKLKTHMSEILNSEIEESEIPQLALVDNEGRHVALEYMLCFGYDDTPGLTLHASDDIALDDYPILGNVHLMNPSKYKIIALDGGKDDALKEWVTFKKEGREHEFEEHFTQKYCSPTGYPVEEGFLSKIFKFL
jgi:hypothetical protein